MKQRLTRFAGTMLGLLALVVVSAAAAAGAIPFLASDNHAPLRLPGEPEGTTVDPLTTILSQYEWVLALLAVVVFLAIARWGFRSGFDLLHGRNESSMHEPWE